MQIRLLACVAGGLLGVAVGFTVNDSMGLSPTLAAVACSAAGVAVGYVVSILVDVFAGAGKNQFNSLKK